MQAIQRPGHRHAQPCLFVRDREAVIAAARAIHGDLSLAALADKIGLHRSNFCAYVNGRRAVTIPAAQAIVQHLARPVGELFTVVATDTTPAAAQAAAARAEVHSFIADALRSAA